MLSYPDYSLAKVGNIILSLYEFPLLPPFRIFHIFRVLEFSVCSVFQNILFFPCFRIFHTFRILEYSVHSAIFRRSTIPFHHSTIPSNRVSERVRTARNQAPSHDGKNVTSCHRTSHLCSPLLKVPHVRAYTTTQYSNLRIF